MARVLSTFTLTNVNTVKRRQKPRTWRFASPCGTFWSFKNVFIKLKNCHKRKQNPPSLFTLGREGIKISHLRHPAVTHAEDCWQLSFGAATGASKCFLMQDVVISDLRQTSNLSLCALYIFFCFLPNPQETTVTHLAVSFAFFRQVFCLTLCLFLYTDHHPILIYYISLLND